jgi:protein phosphatase
MRITALARAEQRMDAEAGAPEGEALIYRFTVMPGAGNPGGRPSLMGRESESMTTPESTESAEPLTIPFCGRRLIGASATHTGKVRPVNEDCHLLADWPDGSAVLAVVADGLGGHGGGEIASSLLVESFGQILSEPVPETLEARYRRFLDLFYHADAAIRETASTDLRLDRMGSTAVALIATPTEYLHLHAGDCRLHQFDRDGNLLHVTTDHSVIQVLLEQGYITLDEVDTHPMRSIVTSCLGGGRSASLTVSPPWSHDGGPQPAVRPFGEGTLLLLCSDGLSGFVDRKRLSALVRRHGGDPAALVRACVTAALDAGGEDNITVLVLCSAEPSSDS